MNRRIVFLVLAVLLLAVSPVLAADGTDTGGLKTIGYVVGMGIASGLCALGQGKADASACEAMARNPGAQAGIRFALILGLVLIESLALYTLVITFIAKG